LRRSGPEPDRQIDRATGSVAHAPLAYALLALGVVPYLIALAATRKTILAPSWPFCARCRALRTRNRIIGLSGIALGIALFCALAAVTNADLAVARVFTDAATADLGTWPAQPR